MTILINNTYFMVRFDGRQWVARHPETGTELLEKLAWCKPLSHEREYIMSDRYLMVQIKRAFERMPRWSPEFEQLRHLLRCRHINGAYRKLCRHSLERAKRNHPKKHPWHC